MPERILLEYSREDHVARVTLNAPKGNVLDAAMMSELHSAFEEFKVHRELKLILFTGSGDHFSFGASVAEHIREKAPAMLAQFHSLFYSLIDLSIPTAAIVSGQCLGGGLELALICNFLFVDQTARLGQPEISLGVFPPPASLILPMRIGQTRADDLLLTGRSVTGLEAVELGLATQLFESRVAMDEGVESWLSTHIMPKSASSLRFAVRAARHGFNEDLREGIKKLEQIYLDGLMTTHDANEGIASFLERRAPVWKNM